MCSTAIGHADCMTNFTTVDYVGTKADADSFRRSKNKVYMRKIALQKGEKVVRVRRT